MVIERDFKMLNSFDTWHGEFVVIKYPYFTLLKVLKMLQKVWLKLLLVVRKMLEEHGFLNLLTNFGISI